MTFCLDEKIEIFGQTIVAKFNISSYNYSCPLCGRYDGGIYDIRQLKILARRHLKKSHGLGIKLTKEHDELVHSDKSECFDGCDAKPINKEKMMDLTTLTIAEIAVLVRKNWGEKVNYGAVPYLDAMYTLDVVDPKTTMYGCDDGVSIVLYFLSNANAFRGAEAREIKKELNRRCK